MKRITLIAMAVMISIIAAVADNLPEGFYRVQNHGSGRYIYVRDSKGTVSTLGADMAAIELWPNLSETISDPGSIIYLKKVGSQYDLLSQGTGVNQLTGAYMTIAYDGNLCQVYSNGQYLYEIGTSDIYPDMGIIGAKTNSEMQGKTQYRLWKTPLVDSNTDNYFGFKPTVTAGGKHYTTFYADFAYTPKANVRTWYVSNIDKQHAIAVIKPISGTVAKQQPVLIECAGSTTADNKVDLAFDGGNTASDNKLKGVFFSNGDRSGLDHTGLEPAVVVFDNTTMRVLDTDANGKLAFVSESDKLTIPRKVYINGEKKTGVKVIPHNQAYLSVDADCPASLQVMTESEYEEYLASLITEIGKADIAIDINIAEPYAESGSDIPASGGTDRAVAKVTYQYLTRTFWSNGTHTDGSATPREMLIYGNPSTAQSLDTMLTERTKVGSSRPQGKLTDAAGNILKAAGVDFTQLTDCEAQADEMDIWQEANKLTDESALTLTLSHDSLTLSYEGDSINLAELVSAQQLLHFTSGSTRDGKILILYSEQAEVEGFTLTDSIVYAAPNELMNERTGYVVLITAQGEGGMEASATVTLAQQAHPSGIETIATSGGSTLRIYDLNGKRINAATLGELPRGIYIINRRKHFINR